MPNALDKRQRAAPARVPGRLKNSPLHDFTSFYSLRPAAPGKSSSRGRAVSVFEERIMSDALPLKALIAISSYHGVIYPDGTKTGLFLPKPCIRSKSSPRLVLKWILPRKLALTV